jgi:hypothetical protein
MLCSSHFAVRGGGLLVGAGHRCGFVSWAGISGGFVCLANNVNDESWMRRGKPGGGSNVFMRSGCDGEVGDLRDVGRDGGIRGGGGWGGGDGGEDDNIMGHGMGWGRGRGSTVQND